LLHLDEHGHALGEPRQLTSGIKNDSAPVWAPDSRRLLFLSNREGDNNQLWLINSDGGEARCLTQLLHGVSEAVWSPDGRWIAFTASADPDEEDDVLLGRKQLDDAAKKKLKQDERTRLRKVTTTTYRLDGRGLFQRFSQLFVMSAPTGANETVNPTAIRRLTSDEIDYRQLSWTPDSTEIGVLCNRNEDRDRTFVSDLWTIHPETGEGRRLTDSTLSIECYAWAPDGQSVMVVGEKDTITYGLDTVRLYLVTRRGKVGDNMLEMTPDLDNGTYPLASTLFGADGPYRPQWSSDGQQIYFLVTEHGCVNVYRMDIVWRHRERQTNGSVTYFLALLPDDHTLLLAQEEAAHPWELYRLADTGERERLTHLYDELVAEIAWARTERIAYQGANGDEIEGWTDT
jgi:dipeptidyl aminopeptidase/acylaminoacyl peptidase